MHPSMKVFPIALPLAVVAAVGSFASSKPKAVPPASKAKPTYAEDVAPLLNRRCVSCHRPGEIGPMTLVGYENAKKWSAMVASVTESRRMPPWKAVAGYGEFHDENRLTQDEIAMLSRWHESGAPRGDKKKEPATPVFKGEWALGTPDLVVGSKQPFKLGPEGADVYRNFVFKTNSKEPMYVTAIDVKPGNRKIVHHVIAFLDDRGQSHRLEAEANDGQEGYTSTGGGVGFLPSGALGGWAPGVVARYTPPGTGFKVEPGSTIVMQVHYHRTGKPETDQTKLGLYFAKEPVQKEMRLMWAMNGGIRIPAGKPDYQATLAYPVLKDATLYGVMPHMHLLGKKMKAWLDLPDGTNRPLVYVDDWDFNWQLFYTLKEPIKVPAGSKLRVEAVYDNSKDNPRQPSYPPHDVTWGEGTYAEMFLLLAAYTLD
jgi:hypothetical protein